MRVILECFVACTKLPSAATGRIEIYRGHTYTLRGAACYSQCCILYKLSYPVYQQLIKTELDRKEQQTKANENRLDSDGAKQQINSIATKQNTAITE